MGWFWANDNPKGSSSTPTASSTSTPTASSTSTPTSTPPSAKQPPASPPTSDIDPELQQFIALFSASTQPTTTSTTNPSSLSSPSPSSSSSSSWLPSFVTPSPTPEPPSTHIPPTLSPIAESLYPPTMSCSAAFDAAFACQSFGGQWTSIYRTGEMRTCGDIWSDFWFCMRHNGTSGPVTENLIKSHYRRKEYEKYYMPGKKSSEDIWRARTERVPVGTAFRTPIPSFDEEE